MPRCAVVLLRSIFIERHRNLTSARHFAHGPPLWGGGHPDFYSGRTVARSLSDLEGDCQLPLDPPARNRFDRSLLQNLRGLLPTLRSSLSLSRVRTNFTSHVVRALVLDSDLHTSLV